MRWLSIQNLVSRFVRSRSTSKLFAHMHRQSLPLLRSHPQQINDRPDRVSKLPTIHPRMRVSTHYDVQCIFCMAFQVVTLRWQTCHSYSFFLLLGHVACIQNKLDRPVAWYPQSQSVSSMFTTSESSWVCRLTFYYVVDVY